MKSTMWWIIAGISGEYWTLTNWFVLFISMISRVEGNICNTWIN